MQAHRKWGHRRGHRAEIKEKKPLQVNVLQVFLVSCQPPIPKKPSTATAFFMGNFWGTDCLSGVRMHPETHGAHTAAKVRALYEVWLRKLLETVRKGETPPALAAHLAKHEKMAPAARLARLRLGCRRRENRRAPVV